jgi:hypothetical protein
MNFRSELFAAVVSREQFEAIATGRPAMLYCNVQPIVYAFFDTVEDIGERYASDKAPGSEREINIFGEIHREVAIRPARSKSTVDEQMAERHSLLNCLSR